MNTDKLYISYARDVVNGKIVAGHYVRKACERFVHDFSREDLTFDYKAVDNAIQFCHLFRHYEGQFSGQPFRLEGWQQFIIANMFGWVRTDGRKRYQDILIQVARKNGKSFLQACLALLALMTEPSAQVVCCANSRTQAGLLFNMCNLLAKQLDPRRKILQTFRNEIRMPKNAGAILKTIAADSGTADGLNVSFGIYDEIHAAPLPASGKSSMYDVMKSSMGSRRSAQMVCITTAGYNTQGVGYQLIKNAQDVLNGEKEDDNTFALLYAIDDEDDWQDEKCWQKASPNLGVSVGLEWYRAQASQARNMVSKRTDFMIKQLCRWQTSAEQWLDIEQIKNVTDDVPWTLFIDGQSTTWVGVDLASTNDLTAVSYMTVREGRTYIKTEYYMPSSALIKQDNSTRWQQMKDGGHLTCTEGNVTDYDYIVSSIIAHQNQGMLVNGLAYDKYNATQFIITLNQHAGVRCVAYSQTLTSFNIPTKQLEMLINSKGIVIDNNPLNAFCLLNCSLMRSSDGTLMKPTKARGEHGGKSKIDGVIAMCQALGLYMNDNNVQFVGGISSL